MLLHKRVLLRWLTHRSWLLPLVFVGLAGPARAGNIFTDSDPEPAPSTPAASAPASSGWYGRQIALADGASIAVFFGGLAARSTPLADAGLAGWIGGGPVVHLVHGNVGRGFLSVALRLGLPMLGGWAASRVAGHCGGQPGTDGDCGVVPELLAITGAALVAEMIDLSVLAPGGQPRTAPGPTPPGEFPVGLVLTPRDGGVVAGYRGRF